MSKKLLVLAIAAGLLLVSARSFALDCQHDNKVSMDPKTQICCCKEGPTNHFACKPMGDKGDKKCPGKVVAAGDELNTTKISTQANDTCVCQFDKK